MKNHKLRKYIREIISKDSASVYESNIRVVVRNILKEELTKTDKKEIDRLIQRAINDDRSEQKKIIEKQVEEQLKDSFGKTFFGQPKQFNQLVVDICKEELAKEVPAGSDLEDSMVEIVKKVLNSWHEMLYKQPHIMQRVKIKR